MIEKNGQPEQTIVYTIGDSLYLNITDRCTLACSFCPKNQGSHQVHDYNLTLDHLPNELEIQSAIGDPQRYREIVFCGYGEPTLRLKMLLQVAKSIKERGGMVRVNTDGLANLVYKRNALQELSVCVDSISVSMNAQDEATYDRHCLPSMGGAFQAMLVFLEEAPRFIPVVTATAIEGLEGVDIAACRLLAEKLGVKFKKRTLDVVG
ncbi:MAG: radical SAM protein [Gammaproteobacteria bacterium]|nr:radical SAM protein [Gammaproteobacteria bacterium]